ncbi:MAG: hypothetical protein ACLFU6_01035 [Candidatus Hydrogenedentota bacterium]
METIQQLEKLCESWWDHGPEPDRRKQTHFARQFLTLLGWGQPEPLVKEDEDEESALAVSFSLSGGSRAILAHFVAPGILEPPGTLVDSNLDFCCATRILADEGYEYNADYVFITDLSRSYLYDMQTEELLLWANGADEFKGEFAQSLQYDAVAQGSLDELRRQPRSYTARQLREWRHRWGDAFAREAGVNEETAAAFFDRLVVVRYLLEREVLKRPGWRLRQEFCELVGQAMEGVHKDSGKGFGGLCHDIYFDWQAAILAPSPQLDVLHGRDDLVGPCLGEFALLGRGKFNANTILESFNYGPADEKARVRMIPEENHQRRSLLNKATPATADQLQVEIDLLDEGYRAIPHWFDALVEVYQRLEKGMRTQQRVSSSDEENMDLLKWSEHSAHRPRALQEPYQHAAERGLVIYCASARQWRTARLVLYLHLIGRYDRDRDRFVQFPQLESALKPRPKTLSRDRDRGAFSESSEYRQSG